MLDKILHDPIFFYAVAYVIFLVIAWVFIRKPALEWIDGEIGAIRKDLDQARLLRKEAEAALAEARVKKSAALVEAEAIVKHAREEAVRLQAEADARLKDVLARHEQHASERIRIAEQEAVAQVRATAVDRAMTMVRKALSERMDEANGAKLADQAIADMPKLSSAKAKAA